MNDCDLAQGRAVERHPEPAGAGSSGTAEIAKADLQVGSLAVLTTGETGGVSWEREVIGLLVVFGLLGLLVLQRRGARPAGGKPGPDARVASSRLGPAAIGFTWQTLWRYPLGRAAKPRSMEVLERLSLTPQHSLHLLRVGDRQLVVATYPQGCSVLTAEHAGTATVEAELPSPPVREPDGAANPGDAKLHAESLQHNDLPGTQARTAAA